MKLFLSLLFLTQFVFGLTKIPNSMLQGPTTLTAVSGTLSIANGGTGQTTKTPAFNALSPLTTKGDLLVIIASGDNTRKAVGTDGQVLTADSSDATGVKWATPPAQLEISASYYVSANFAAAATTPINYDTQIWDTNSAVTTSPTAWKFTVPSGYAGKYQVTILTTGNVGDWMILRKNGTNTQRIHYSANWALKADSGSTFIQLAVGDYIDIVPTGAFTCTGGILSTGPCTITITRIGN